MKRIILAAVLIIILLQLKVNAGVLCQASAPGNANQGYKLQSVTVSGENIQLVQFTLAEDCYVTIRVMDSDLTELADGEMEKGAYNVYYKSNDGRSTRSVKCMMEIYRDPSKTEVICMREIILQGK
ncbi:MAG: hypothetical protein KBF96_10070 [Ignavibacteria bacterium]|nr:hypothetical protein [Ignavibacteria bacterium]